VNVHHVPSHSANLLSISQLTQIGKIVEFWLDHFFLRDVNNDILIVTEGFLDSKDQLYKLCDLS
jgi:hypothetical protein